ncbi:MAG TPA: hypothetical protein VM936_17735 [Pyrinomonadaceae bacterium]|jgi:hypothetical protein|nr:hypothetical protein [Pyrinomonadaceae bacterium]
MAAASDDFSFMDRQFGRKPADEDRGDRFEPNLAFVIMSFGGQGMDDTFSAIRDECAKLGLRALRADDNTGAGFIIKEIVEAIESAEFIICDLTHERPNVYYELGYAHGVGNQPLNMLLVAKEGTLLHFDIMPLRVRFYASTEHLRTIISTNLQRMMELTRKKAEPQPAPPSPADAPRAATKKRPRK